MALTPIHSHLHRPRLHLEQPFLKQSPRCRITPTLTEIGAHTIQAENVEQCTLRT
jgi:hypothetical protein